MGPLVFALHLLGGIGWLGGILFLSLVVPPSERAPLARRFAGVAWALVLLVAASGTWLLLTRFPGLNLMESVEGRALAVKLTAVAILLLNGAALTFYVLPRLPVQYGGPPPLGVPVDEARRAERLAPLLVRLSLGLAVVILVALGFMLAD